MFQIGDIVVCKDARESGDLLKKGPLYQVKWAGDASFTDSIVVGPVSKASGGRYVDEHGELHRRLLLRVWKANRFRLWDDRLDQVGSPDSKETEQSGVVDIEVDI